EGVEPATYSKGNEYCGGNLFNNFEHYAAPLGAGCNVVEHKLVGSTLVIGLCHFNRIADVYVVCELYTLRCLSVPYVEADYNAPFKHGSPSSEMLQKIVEKLEPVGTRLF